MDQKSARFSAEKCVKKIFWQLKKINSLFIKSTCGYEKAWKKILKWKQKREKERKKTLERKNASGMTRSIF